MADITAIRRGIAANLEATFGAAGPQAALGITVSPTIESPPNAPALQVLKGDTNYDEAMQSALAKHDFRVRAYFEMPASAEEQDVLDSLLSYPADESVKAAIEIRDDPAERYVTLGGACGDLTVTDDSGHRIYKLAGIEYLAAEWTIEVWA